MSSALAEVIQELGPLLFRDVDEDEAAAAASEKRPGLSLFSLRKGSRKGDRDDDHGKSRKISAPSSTGAELGEWRSPRCFSERLPPVQV